MVLKCTVAQQLVELHDTGEIQASGSTGMDRPGPIRQYSKRRSPSSTP
jgi:hypothetical protein